MSIYDVFSGGGRPFNKEEWAAQKQEQRKAAYELIDTTCEKMMADGERLRRRAGRPADFHGEQPV